MQRTAHPQCSPSLFPLTLHIAQTHAHGKVSRASFAGFQSAIPFTELYVDGENYDVVTLCVLYDRSRRVKAHGLGIEQAQVNSA